jgi:predicted phosphodiesterase
MRQYTDDAILDFIEKKFSENNPISLRAIANHFNTSHSQIKRILIRNNNYEEYLRRKEEIILQQEERNNDNCISQGESLDDNDFDVDEVLKSLRDVNDKINLDVEELNSDYDKYKDIIPLIYKDRNIVGFICDIHLGHHDTEALNIALNYLRERKIKKLVIGGDLLDNESVSFWKSRGTLTFKEEIDLAKDFFNQLKKLFPTQDIYYIAGNHSLFYEKHILSHVKQLYELEHFRLNKILGLEDYNVTWVDNRDYIKKYGYPFKIGKLNYLHGHEIRCSYGSVNVARTMFLKAQANIIFGHFHQTQEYIFRNIAGEVLGSWSVGCLCNLAPDYAPVNGWCLGFALIQYDNNWDEFRVYNKKIINGDIF